jgi:hypothetical protein
VYRDVSFRFLCVLWLFVLQNTSASKAFTKSRVSPVIFHEERRTQVQSLHYLEDSEVIWLHGFKPSGTDNTPVPIV